MCFILDLLVEYVRAFLNRALGNRATSFYEHTEQEEVKINAQRSMDARARITGGGQRFVAPSAAQC